MELLRLDLDIYSMEKIEESIQAYKDYIDIEVEYIDECYAYLKFKCDYNYRQLYMDEFCNYLIYLIGK